MIKSVTSNSRGNSSKCVSYIYKFLSKICFFITVSIQFDLHVIPYLEYQSLADIFL